MTDVKCEEKVVSATIENPHGEDLPVLESKSETKLSTEKRLMTSKMQPGCTPSQVSVVSSAKPQQLVHSRLLAETTKKQQLSVETPSLRSHHHQMSFPVTSSLLPHEVEDQHLGAPHFDRPKLVDETMQAFSSYSTFIASHGTNVRPPSFSTSTGPSNPQRLKSVLIPHSSQQSIHPGLLPAVIDTRRSTSPHAMSSADTAASIHSGVIRAPFPSSQQTLADEIMAARRQNEMRKQQQQIPQQQQHFQTLQKGSEEYRMFYLQQEQERRKRQQQEELHQLTQHNLREKEKRRIIAEKIHEDVPMSGEMVKQLVQEVYSDKPKPRNVYGSHESLHQLPPSATAQHPSPSAAAAHHHYLRTLPRQPQSRSELNQRTASIPDLRTGFASESALQHERGIIPAHHRELFLSRQDLIGGPAGKFRELSGKSSSRPSSADLVKVPPPLVTAALQHEALSRRSPSLERLRQFSGSPDSDSSSSTRGTCRASTIVRPWESSSMEEEPPPKLLTTKPTPRINVQQQIHPTAAKSEQLSPFIQLTASNKDKAQIIQMAHNSPAPVDVTKFLFNEEMKDSNPPALRRLSSEQPLSPTFPLRLKKPDPTPSAIVSRPRSDSEETISADEEERKLPTSVLSSINKPDPRLATTSSSGSFQSTLLMKRLQVSSKEEMQHASTSSKSVISPKLPPQKVQPQVSHSMASQHHPQGFSRQFFLELEELEKKNQQQQQQQQKQQDQQQQQQKHLQQKQQLQLQQHQRIRQLEENIKQLQFRTHDNDPQTMMLLPKDVQRQILILEEEKLIHQHQLLAMRREEEQILKKHQRLGMRQQHEGEPPLPHQQHFRAREEEIRQQQMRFHVLEQQQQQQHRQQQHGIHSPHSSFNTKHRENSERHLFEDDQKIQQQLKLQKQKQKEQKRLQQIQIEEDHIKQQQRFHQIGEEKQKHQEHLRLLEESDKKQRQMFQQQLQIRGEESPVHQQLNLRKLEEEHLTKMRLQSSQQQRNITDQHIHEQMKAIGDERNWKREESLMHLRQMEEENASKANKRMNTVDEIQRKALEDAHKKHQLRQQQLAEEHRLQLLEQKQQQLRQRENKNISGLTSVQKLDVMSKPVVKQNIDRQNELQEYQKMVQQQLQEKGLESQDKLAYNLQQHQQQYLLHHQVRQQAEPIEQMSKPQEQLRQKPQQLILRDLQELKTHSQATVMPHTESVAHSVVADLEPMSPQYLQNASFPYRLDKQQQQHSQQQNQLLLEKMKQQQLEQHQQHQQMHLKQQQQKYQQDLLKQQHPLHHLQPQQLQQQQQQEQKKQQHPQQQHQEQTLQNQQIMLHQKKQQQQLQNQHKQQPHEQQQDKKKQLFEQKQQLLKLQQQHHEDNQLKEQHQLHIREQLQVQKNRQTAERQMQQQSQQQQQQQKLQQQHPQSLQQNPKASTATISFGIKDTETRKQLDTKETKRSESPDIYDLNVPENVEEKSQGSPFDLYSDVTQNTRVSDIPITTVGFPKTDVDLFYTAADTKPDQPKENVAERKSEQENEKEQLTASSNVDSSIPKDEEEISGGPGTPVMDEPAEENLQKTLSDNLALETSRSSTPEAHTPLMDERREFHFEPVPNSEATQREYLQQFQNPSQQHYQYRTVTPATANVSADNPSSKPSLPKGELFESISPPSSPERKSSSGFFPVTTAPTTTAVAFPFSALAINVTGSRPGSRCGSLTESSNPVLSSEEQLSKADLENLLRQSKSKRKRDYESDEHCELDPAPPAGVAKRMQSRTNRRSGSQSSSSSISKSPEYEYQLKRQ